MRRDSATFKLEEDSLIQSVLILSSTSREISDTPYQLGRKPAVGHDDASFHPSTNRRSDKLGIQYEKSQAIFGTMDSIICLIGFNTSLHTA